MQIKLQSLRTQMNPHFIFNSLNSVNNFISKNDERSANRYLTDFSKLMRTVLKNSDQDFVSLETEIESFGDLTRARDFADRAEEIREELEGSIGVIRGTLEGLVGQTILKYAEEEKERSLLASFNSDVEKIYNNANEGIEELRSDLNRIIQHRVSPTRSKR